MNRDYFNFIIIGSYKKSPEQLLGLHDFSHSLKNRSKIDFLVIFKESTLPHQRHKDFAMIQLPIGIAKFSQERRNSGHQSN